MHQSLHLLRRHARVHPSRRRSRTVPITTHAQVPRSDQSQTVRLGGVGAAAESRHRLVIPGVFPDVFLIRGRVTIQIEPSLFRPHSRPRGRERDEREDHQRRRDDGDGAPATPRARALDASTSPVALAVSASSSGDARSCARSSLDIARDGVRIHAARTVATVDRDRGHVLVLRRPGNVRRCEMAALDARRRG